MSGLGEADEQRSYRVSGKTARALQGNLERLARGDQIGQGRGVRRRSIGNDGYAFSSGRRTRRGTRVPWQVFVRVNPENPEQYQAKVYLESSVLDSLQPSDRLTVTGLDEWFVLQPEDLIWLELTFNGAGEVTSAEIASWGQGDEFEPDAPAWAESGYVEGDGGDPEVHEKSRMMIAYSHADEDKPVLVQCARVDMILRNVCVDGRAARFPFPAPYSPYISEA